MSAVAGQPRRVVVVEDEPLIVMLITDMLEELGHELVGACGSIEDALKLVQREAFDVALLDIDLGGKSGYAVADVVVARGIPIVLMSGFSGRPPSPYQEVAVLGKPFQLDDLERVLKSIPKSP